MSLLLLFESHSPATGISTRSKRASVVHFLQFSTLAPVDPDGTLTQGDRQHIAQTYSGILATYHEFFTADAGEYTLTGTVATLRGRTPKYLRIQNAMFADSGVRMFNPRRKAPEN